MSEKPLGGLVQAVVGHQHQGFSRKGVGLGVPQQFLINFSELPWDFPGDLPMNLREFPGPLPGIPRENLGGIPGARTENPSGNFPGIH